MHLISIKKSLGICLDYTFRGWSRMLLNLTGSGSKKHGFLHDCIQTQRQGNRHGGYSMIIKWKFSLDLQNTSSELPRLKVALPQQPLWVPTTNGEIRKNIPKWVSSWDYGTYHIGDQRRLRRTCASALSCQSLRCSHLRSMGVDEGSDKKSDI